MTSARRIVRIIIYFIVRKDSIEKKTAIWTALLVFVLLLGCRKGDQAYGQWASEEERFISFGAEVSCARYNYTASADDEKDRAKRDEYRRIYRIKVNETLARYGYTEKEAESLSEKYAEDIGYAEAVVAKVKVICPEAAEDLETNLHIMKNGMSVKIRIENKTGQFEIEYDYYYKGYINSGTHGGSGGLEGAKEELKEIFKDNYSQALQAAVYTYS